MGLDIRAAIYVGVQCVQRMMKHKVTRYNEETGEPYEKEVEIEEWYFEQSGIIPFDFDDFDKDIENLAGIHLPYFEANYGVFGFKIAETDSHRNGNALCAVDKEKINLNIKLFSDKYKVNPSVILMPIISY